MFASYMLNSWIMGTIAGLLAGTIGFFVVLRQASFPAHALPLGAFPGAAAADLLGLPRLAGLACFALLGVCGIAWLGRHQRRDVATALILVTLLGLGTLFLSLSGHYAQGVYALLFGQLVAVSSSTLLPTALLAAALLLAIAALFRPLLLSAIAPDLLAAQGGDPQRMEFAFLALLGLATAATLPVVGALLVFSLMVGPPAAARRLAARPGIALALAAALSLLTIWSAIALAYETDWPIGFFVGGIAAGLYAAAGWAAPRLSPRRPAAVPPG